MTRSPPCRLWEVGNWSKARRIGGTGGCFSPDGRLVVVQEASKLIRLVETETGRTMARLESPDLCEIWPTFSPDGSRLVVTTNDGPAVHVWDLRAIRKQLIGMDLDWNAPAFSDDDPASPSAPPLPPLQVDYGPLTRDLEHFTESPEALLERYTARLKDDANDAEAYHHRAHALADLNRFAEAIDDFTRAIRLRPDDVHFRAFRGRIYQSLKQHDPAIADLEAALARKTDEFGVRERLALLCNNRAWELAKAPEPRRDLDRALALSRRSLALDPDQIVSLNTLGVVEYRVGRYAEAIATLERSLASNRGQSDAFDLFFMAMAHHRLGHREEARSCFDRAVRWLAEKKGLSGQYATELAAFRAEAEAVLAGTVGELPAKVLAEP